MDIERRPSLNETAAGRPRDRPRLVGSGAEEVGDDEDLEVHDDLEPDLVLPGGWAERFEFEGKGKRDHDAAIAADARILTRLQLESFEGRTWTQQERRFVAYARRVLPGLIYKGRIFVMMRQLDIPGARSMTLPSKGLRLSAEEARDLADETIARSIEPFKRTLMRGRWQPDADTAAQLTSFFVGQCCWQFRGPWRRYMRERTSAYEAWRLEQEEADLLQRSVGSDRSEPGRSIVVRLEIDEAFAFLDDDIDREILQLSTAGYTDAEVGIAVGGLSSRQVEYRRKVIRNRLTQLQESKKLRDVEPGVA